MDLRDELAASFRPQQLPAGTLGVASELLLAARELGVAGGKPLRAVVIEKRDVGIQKHLRVSVDARPGEAPVDLVWSALPPSESYDGVAFSEPYTHLPYVLARRAGDGRIRGLRDLDGKVLGCINDPAAFATLEEAGVRWRANAERRGGTVRLANLIAYGDQSRIHDALADGAVDAFAVDHPIYYWACTAPESRWRGRIEILPGNLAAVPWHYAVGVKADAASWRLLAKVNEFIAWFAHRPERLAIERTWQGEPLTSTRSYRDEPGRLLGEPDLRGLYEQRQATLAAAAR